MAKAGSKRIQKPRTKVTKNTRTEVEDDSQTRAEAKRKALNEGMDELLDEIDGVLEHNAEEFVNSYVQRGGE